VTGLLVNLIGDLFLGLIFGLSVLFVSRLLHFGVFFGSAVGIVSIAIEVKPVEKMVFHWTDLSSRKSAALRSGLIAWLPFGLFYGLFFVYNNGLYSGLFAGLAGGLSVGLLVGLVRLFTSEAMAETRSTPNQGTHRSLRLALISGLISGLISTSILELIDVLRYGPLIKQVEVARGALGIGLLAGLFCGGAFSIKHYVLHLLLWLNGSAPLNYVAFLNQAKELLFLRQVGGGYIFTHRLLREYFASLSQAEKEAEPRAKAAPAA
jgi:hypothetical protein